MLPLKKEHHQYYSQSLYTLLKKRSQRALLQNTNKTFKEGTRPILLQIQVLFLQCRNNNSTKPKTHTQLPKEKHHICSPESTYIILKERTPPIIYPQSIYIHYSKKKQNVLPSTHINQHSIFSGHNRNTERNLHISAYR